MRMPTRSTSIATAAIVGEPSPTRASPTVPRPGARGRRGRAGAARSSAAARADGRAGARQWPTWPVGPASTSAGRRTSNGPSQSGRLYLLQSRPITSLAAVADPDGVLNIWDNSNIAESYNGVTTPLTFSFARRAYEEVYRQFCRILRVPEAKIIEHSANVFRHMLGLIRGRIYYNLLNWYRLLALLPGFRSTAASWNR